MDDSKRNENAIIQPPVSEANNDDRRKLLQKAATLAGVVGLGLGATNTAEAAPGGGRLSGPCGSRGCGDKHFRAITNDGQKKGNSPQKKRPNR